MESRFKPIIAGVDIGTRLVTICMLDAQARAAFQRLEVAKGVDALEASRVLAELARGVSWPGVVWVERPFGRHVRSVSDLSRVVGVVVAALPRLSAVCEIGPSEWKSAVGLPGNAKKLDVQEWAAERGHPGLDEHSADAYAIAVVCYEAGARAAA